MRARLRYAHLNGADGGLIELALAALPFGKRAALTAYGVTTPQAKPEEETVAVALTAHGRAVIAACALEQAPPTVRETIKELDEARARWRASPAAARARLVSNRKR